MSSASVWELAREQHGVVTRRQLVRLGLGSDAIKHRLSTGRLHRVRRGVYAVGRPQLTQRGEWMAAVLACGPTAVLSHASAAVHWKLLAEHRGPTHVSVTASTVRRTTGVAVHRRIALGTEDVTRRHGIPVTTPVATLVDLATELARPALERAVNEADKLELADPEELRAALARLAGRPGVAALRTTLDRATFTLTDSELEGRFLPIVRRAGLTRPETGRRLNGFKVDFYWHDLGLVVETDGLRYHRTPVQQARDRIRDQTHAAAGLTPLRFTHAQVAFEPEHVRSTLAAVGRRLREKDGH